MQHEQLQEEEQHEKLQEEVEHEQLQRQRPADDEEDYELQQQRLQRRQQLYELQQQLQILRELQQLHQQVRPINASDASDASDEESEGDDETEDVQREVTTSTDGRPSAAGHQTTTNATNGDSYDDALDVYIRDGDAADAHVEEQILDIMKGDKRDALCESLSDNDQVDTGLPLLHRINEALKEAAGILSQSMGDCVVVDKLESGIKQELSIISGRRNGGHSSGDNAVESRLTDGLMRTDDVSGALNSKPRSPCNECDRPSIELPVTGDARVAGRDERPRHVCEATPTPEQCRAETTVEIETSAQRKTRCNEDESATGSEEKRVQRNTRKNEDESAIRVEGTAGRKPRAPDEELSVGCLGHHARGIDGSSTHTQLPSMVSITCSNQRRMFEA